MGLDSTDEYLIGTTEHSVLGKRWVYDGCADPVAVSAILTGDRHRRPRGRADHGGGRRSTCGSTPRAE